MDFKLQCFCIYFQLNSKVFVLKIYSRSFEGKEYLLRPTQYVEWNLLRLCLPPNLAGGYYLHPRRTCHISHNALLCNSMCSVTWCVTYWGAQTEKMQKCCRVVTRLELCICVHALKRLRYCYVHAKLR